MSDMLLENMEAKPPKMSKSKRFELKLIKELGKDYLAKLEVLRVDLNKVADLEDLTLMDIAYHCKLSISTVSLFLQSKTIFREPMAMSNKKGRKKFKKPQGPISPKTYFKLKKYTDKKLKK